MEWGSKYGDKLNAKVLAAGDEAAGSWILPWCPRYNSSLVVEPPAAEHMKPSAVYSMSREISMQYTQ